MVESMKVDKTNPCKETYTQKVNKMEVEGAGDRDTSWGIHRS